MDVEQEISSTIKVDSKTREDLFRPPLESVASTSDGRSSQITAEIQAFSGRGRTLGETGKGVEQSLNMS